jgi:hypothetical protein
MMNASFLRSRPETRPHVRRYRHLNHMLDQQVVPFAVNETTIVALRDALEPESRPPTAVYGLLTARLAEMALLCAGHYADCGEIGAAGDLLLNPRRIDIHVRERSRPIVKERHRRLSEQLNPDGLPFPAFTAWFRRNAVTEVVEQALLPDLFARLENAGWLAATFLRSFQERMSRVADAMRFASAATGPAAHSERPLCQMERPPEAAWQAAHRCRFDTTDYHRLGRDIARTCDDPAYHSPYLVARRVPENTAAATAELHLASPPAPISA